MRNLRLFTSFVLSLLILASCGVSDNGFSGGLIQKRKYTKGFYMNRNASAKHSDKKEEGFKRSEILNDRSQVIEKNDPVLIEQVEAIVLDEQQVQGNGGTQQKKEETSKATTKKKTTGTKKTTSTQQRKVREPEYYMPIQTKKSVAKIQAVQNKTATSGSSAGSDVNTILLVIVALLIPPLAVAIYEGITSRFWIDLILAILGYGIGFGLLGGGLGFLCALVAVIYALLIVLEVI